MGTLTPEIVAELRAAIDRAESLDGWFTTTMIADALGCSMGKARNTLRELLKAGRLDVDRRTISEGYLGAANVPVYRLREDG